MVLVAAPLTVTVWPLGMVPDKVGLPDVTSRPPVPAESTMLPPVKSTGLPDSVPPDWVQVPPLVDRVPVRARLPPDWVKLELPESERAAPLPTLNDPLFVVRVVLSWSLTGAPRETVPPASLVSGTRM